MPQDHDRIKPIGVAVTQTRLAEINHLEPEMADLSDDELRRKTEKLKAGGGPEGRQAIRVLMRPRTLAVAVEQHCAGRDFWAALNEFLDEFYAAGDERQSTIEQEPAHHHLDDYVGATGEHLARRWGLELSERGATKAVCRTLSGRLLRSSGSRRLA
jgi:hypothetical protein